jgi:hypothetical protein
VLKSLDAADFDRTMFHPEHGKISLDSLLAIYAWHGPHHTAHVTELRGREGF